MKCIHIINNLFRIQLTDYSPAYRSIIIIIIIIIIIVLHHFVKILLIKKTVSTDSAYFTSVKNNHEVSHRRHVSNR